MDQTVYDWETREQLDGDPYRALSTDLISLTLKGEAYCYLMKLRRLVVDMNGQDRVEIVEQMHEMLDNMAKAA